MAQRIIVDSNRETLTGSEAAAAVSQLVVPFTGPFRAVTTTANDSVIAGQQFALTSYQLFKEPKKLHTGKFVYGFVKVRGVTGTEQEAKNLAGKIIREQDSNFVIDICHVGEWVPITDDINVSEERIDINTDPEQKIPALRAQAVKDKEAEERRIVRDLKEREEQIKRDGDDVYDDKESLNFYAMRRTVELKLQEEHEILMHKAHDVLMKLKHVREGCRLIEKNHGDYRGQWLDLANTKRKGVGIGNWIPPAKHIESYEGWIDRRNKEEAIETVERNTSIFDMPRE